MSKRKLEDEAETAAEPVSKKLKEEVESLDPVRSRFRRNLFETDEFDKHFSAYSESTP